VKLSAFKDGAWGVPATEAVRSREYYPSSGGKCEKIAARQERDHEKTICFFVVDPAFHRCLFAVLSPSTGDPFRRNEEP
jgi:hypothetical protein